MNIRYTLLALMIVSPMSQAEQPDVMESIGSATSEAGGRGDLAAAVTPKLDISASLAEKLDRQLEQSTTRLSMLTPQRVRTNLTPGG